MRDACAQRVELVGALEELHDLFQLFLLFTLSNLVPMLKMRNPNSVKICTILDKPSRRKADIQPDYEGFQVPDEFVVGYGLDYAERYRNLPYLGILKPEVYS